MKPAFAVLRLGKSEGDGNADGRVVRRFCNVDAKCLAMKTVEKYSI